MITTYIKGCNEVVRTTVLCLWFCEIDIRSPVWFGLQGAYTGPKMTRPAQQIPMAQKTVKPVMSLSWLSICGLY